MNTNLCRESIQQAVREALAAGTGNEQIRAWVDEILIDAVDYCRPMTRCYTEHSTP